MWPDPRLMELLQIEHPLVLAPMAGNGTVELAPSICGRRRLRLDRLRWDATRARSQDDPSVASADWAEL
jgi:hypothetical protein